jgi:thiol-disulfide isomerase/thioredoxin
MYNFAVTNVDGQKVELASLLETKKAVILNFFYKDCNPCKSEFPAMQKAYESYTNEVAFVTLDNQDTEDEIRDFRTNLESAANDVDKFTMDFCYDSAGLHTYFSVSAWPTTVVIDRYGVISYINSGAIPNEGTWRSLIAEVVADDYTQNPTTSDTEESTEATPPTEGLEMSSSDDIIAAIGAPSSTGTYEPETNENDAPYSWPWVIETDENGEKYLGATNLGANNSFSILIMKNISLKQNDILSFEVKYNTEDSDVLYVILNGESALYELSGASDGWQKVTLYTAGRDTDIEIALVYQKDLSLSSENEFVGIRNVKVENALESTSALDIQRSAAYNSGTGSTNGKAYDTYATIVYNETDGYYHVGTKDGPLLLADIIYSTAWSLPHAKSKTVELEGGSEYPTSPFYIDFCQWEADTTDLNIVWRNIDYTTYCIDNFYYEQYSENNLIPVTAELRQMLIDFTYEYATRNGANSTWYEDQWIEFCYYYDHIGANHASGDFCNSYDDPVRGMTYTSAYTATEGKNTVSITEQIGIAKYAGALYKFVPSNTGVYYIYSKTESDLYDPTVTLLDEDGNTLTYEDDAYFADSTTGNYLFDFHMYYYFTANKTYYLRFSLGTNEVGVFDVQIEYTQKESVDLLVLASDHQQPGIWTITLEAYESGNFDDTTYGIATNIGVNTNDKDGALGNNYSIYYAVNENNEYVSPLYIDFLHPCLLFTSGESLADMIDAGFFNLPDSGKTLTNLMRKYLAASTEGKSEDDPLYGMVKADTTLVYYLCAMLNYQKSDTTNDSAKTNFWMVFACYYMTIDENNYQAIK